MLAAGLGTRLRPLTLERAKPSLPVLGVPVLWFGVSHLSRELGITEFAMNVSHAPESLRQASSDAELVKRTGARFHISDETDLLLGSSGALWKLASWIGRETLAVWNGDNICYPSWKRMLEAHKKSGALLTMHVRAFSGSHEPYTDIDVGPDGRVRGFKAKATSGIMFSSCYLFEPELISRLPAGVSELRPAILEPLAREGRLHAFREDIEWLDIGNVSAYADANFELLSRLSQARELVETKMREAAPGCWVPKSWDTKTMPPLKAPVALLGEQGAWRATGAKELGPRLIGIDPPDPGTSRGLRDAIVYSGKLESL